MKVLCVQTTADLRNKLPADRLLRRLVWNKRKSEINSQQEALELQKTGYECQQQHQPGPTTILPGECEPPSVLRITYC